MRGDDRESIQGVMGMMRIPIGTGNSKISLLSDLDYQKKWKELTETFVK